MTAGFGRRVAIAVTVAVGLALVVQVVAADGPDAISGGIGGDYAAFYAAGDVLLDEPGLEADALYDPQAQFDAQDEVLESDEDGNLYFAYPAFFVVPYVPLAALSFGASYLVHTALMAGALAAAVFVLRPVSAVLRDHPVEAFAVALTFYPLFRGVTGGQNTALSLLLVALVWRGLHDGREVPAGVAVALLLFKPPLALPFLGALVLSRRWRAVAAAVATVAVLDLVGAAATDLSWPSAWVDAVRYLDRVDTPFNVHNFVSLPGVGEAILGIDSTAGAVLGFGLAAVVAAIVAWAWFTEAGGLDCRIALTAAGALAISPHALYYDAGLLVMVALVLVDRDIRMLRYVAPAWLLGLSHLAAEDLGASPLAALVVAALVAAAAALTRSGTGRSSTGRRPRISSR